MYKTLTLSMRSTVKADWYDYGFRQYDPQIGRFLSLDPMAVFSPGISPYAYAIDNPILFNRKKKSQYSRRSIEIGENPYSS